MKSRKITEYETVDITRLFTTYLDSDLKGWLCDDLDERAVSYVIKTPAGTIYHSGDSHFGNMYAKHGNEHKIDVAFGSLGENPRGVTDKMTSVNIMRMGEALNCKVMIPYHHDLWTNFKADTHEVLLLWYMRRNRLQYKFKPFIWEVGGMFTYPNDKDLIEYHYPRGFDDVFEDTTNLPFHSFL